MAMSLNWASDSADLWYMCFWKKLHQNKNLARAVQVQKGPLQEPSYLVLTFFKTQKYQKRSA